MNSKKYHFLVARLNYYEGSSFDELLEEESKYGGYIYWAISSKNGKYLHHIEKGDVCVLYYSDLPDDSSRIFFVGDVIDSDYNNKKTKDSICPDPEEGKLYVKLKIKAISFTDNEKIFFRIIKRKIWTNK